MLMKNDDYDDQTACGVGEAEEVVAKKMGEDAKVMINQKTLEVSSCMDLRSHWDRFHFHLSVPWAEFVAMAYYDYYGGAGKMASSYNLYIPSLILYHLRPLRFSKCYLPHFLLARNYVVALHGVGMSQVTLGQYYYLSYLLDQHLLL